MSVEFNKDASLRAAVLTVSDTRTEETDKSGRHIRQLLRENGHEPVRYAIVKDEQERISAAVAGCLEEDEIDVILITGGTGIARRDITIEAVELFFTKNIPGFGELFRYLSFAEDIGSKAMLSRATAGIASDKLIFAMPGSRGAVDLAMRRLILPELAHLLFEIRK